MVGSTGVAHPPSGPTPATAPAVGPLAGPLRDRLAAVSAQFAWDGTSLAVTEPAVLSRLVDRTMSASTMTSLGGCPSRWAFEKVWPGDPDPFSPALVGNGAHTVLERLYALPPEQRTVDAAMIIARRVAAEQMPGDDPLSLAVRDRWMAEVYTAYKGIFAIEDPGQVNVEGRELKVEAKIAGVGFVGFVDRLERNGDGGLVVVDYKSSQSMPKDIARFGDDHGDQQRLYLLALKEIRGEIPDEAWLLYTRLGKTKKVAQAKGRLSETRDRFVLAAERLALIGEKSALPTVPSPLCGWCPLVNACPAAAKEGKEDRTDHAVDATWLPIPTIGRPTTPARPEGPPAVDDDTLAVAETGSAAHHHADAGDPPRQHATEGDTVPRLKEGQPYVEMADGDLNPNSYAAMATTDLVETSVYVLDKAGVPLTRSGVTALSAMLASVVLDVQRAVTGASSWQDGMNSRARFLVKRVMRALPAPVHGDSADWEDWATKVAKRAGLMWSVAYGLWSDGPDGSTADLAEDVADAIAAAKARQGWAAGSAQESDVEKQGTLSDLLGQLSPRQLSCVTGTAHNLLGQLSPASSAQKSDEVAEPNDFPL